MLFRFYRFSSKHFFYRVGGNGKIFSKKMYSILIVQCVTLLYLKISQTPLRYFGLIFGGV